MKKKRFDLSKIVVPLPGNSLPKIIETKKDAPVMKKANSEEAKEMDEIYSILESLQEKDARILASCLILFLLAKFVGSKAKFMGIISDAWDQKEKCEAEDVKE